jgi:hypothetical protein
MKVSIPGRRTATLIAVAAVVIAFAGSAEAAAAHRSSGDKLIKVHSLSGNRIRKDSLTGTQIRESTLGSVPKAATVNGFTIRKVFFAEPQNTSARTVFSADGLVLKAGCTGTAPTLEATAPASELHVSGVGDGTQYNFDESTAFTASMLAGHNEGSLTAVYATFSGKTITLDLAFDRASTFGAHSDCTVYGTALVD